MIPKEVNGPVIPLEDLKIKNYSLSTKRGETYVVLTQKPKVLPMNFK